jgi:hypothetical protein
MKTKLVVGLCLLMSLGCLKDTGSSAGKFRITGTWASGAAGSTKLTRDPLTDSRTVTHVMAVNPSSTAVQRVVAPVSSTGSFTLDVDGTRPWIIVFLDASRVGTDMIVSMFKAETLDTLTPAAAEGAADLGTVTDTGGTATIGISYADLLARLGLSSEAASYLGAIDDLCLRYVNPDIDGNGIIDTEEADHGFMLDFHVGMAVFVGGRSATIADTINQFIDAATTSVTYGGTGIYVAYPEAFDSTDASLGTIVFDDDVWYTVQLPAGGTSLVHAAAGNAISGSGIIANNFGEYRSFGIAAEGGGGHDMPQGTYVFSNNGKTLTFSNVVTRSDAALTAAENIIMPFIRFNTTDPTCTSACTIANVQYEWRKRTATSWVLATVDEVRLVVNDSGAFISIRPMHDNNASQNVSITIPQTSVSGTLPWDASGYQLMNITDAEALAITTTQLCHVGLSYDDKIGMRIFASVGNAPGTCE